MSTTSSFELRYQCRQRSGLKFSSRESCLVRCARAKARPNDVGLAHCRECIGPLTLTISREKSMKEKESVNSKAKEILDKSEQCKCGRGPILIRKNGVSAGRCSQCISDTSKSRPRRRKKSTMKNTVHTPDSQALVSLLINRKEEAERCLKELSESGSLNGDKAVSQALVAFAWLTATIDAVLSAGIIPSVETKS